jgi:hypothetical protein
MKKLILSILFLGLFTASTWASATLDSGNFTAIYTEPTTNEDGTPLNDLSHTSIYYKLDGGNRVLVTTVPASDIIGGGSITQSFTIEGLGNQVNVEIIYTATDLVGNESGEFIEPIIRVDKVAPNIPTG